MSSPDGEAGAAERMVNEGGPSDAVDVPFVRVAATDEVPDGEMRGFEVNGVKVGVASVEGEYHAFHDCCTHQQYCLTDSWLADDRISCDLHGATFDLRTGEVLTLPATRPLPIFPVEVRDGAIWVAVPDASAIEMPPE
ncbi:MAG: non-heme iron oxygenase ferredoxin subunit [Gemmatimonadota bacterium]